MRRRCGLGQRLRQCCRDGAGKLRRSQNQNLLDLFCELSRTASGLLDWARSSGRRTGHGITRVIVLLPHRCRCPIGASSLLQSHVKQFGRIGGQVRLMSRSAGTRATSIARGYYAKQIGAPQGSHTIVRSASLALPFQRNLYPDLVSELRINWYRTGYPCSIGIAMQIWRRKGSAKKWAALGGPLEK